MWVFILFPSHKITPSQQTKYLLQELTTTTHITHILPKTMKAIINHLPGLHRNHNQKKQDKPAVRNSTSSDPDNKPTRKQLISSMGMQDRIHLLELYAEMDEEMARKLFSQMKAPHRELNDKDHKKAIPKAA